MNFTRHRKIVLAMDLLRLARDAAPSSDLRIIAGEVAWCLHALSSGRMSRDECNDITETARRYHVMLDEADAPWQ